MPSHEQGRVYFPEPEVPNTDWGPRWHTSRYQQTEWLDRSTLPRAVNIRAFLNQSLVELGPKAAQNLAHRFRRDPPFNRVWFEMVVGRFLQVLGAAVEHEPAGVGGKSVDWKATFPSGQAVFVEATSPFYNQRAFNERLRRERLLAIIDSEAPPGWWVSPMNLPRLTLSQSTRLFRQVIRGLMSNLPEPADYSIGNRLRLVAHEDFGTLELELWPGNPTEGAIAGASMGAHWDDSYLRSVLPAVKVADAVRRKGRQARAFPGEMVLLAIDSPFMGPDLHHYDIALFGRSTTHVSIDLKETGRSFDPSGVLATQRRATLAGVLAFEGVGVFGANDPVVYMHPRFKGLLPPDVLRLRQRRMGERDVIDVPATRISLTEGIGFPSPGRGA